MKKLIILLLILIFISGCDKTLPDKHSNASSNQTINQSTDQEVKQYNDTISFYTYIDPKENAFSINIPENWEVSDDSGLVRPYIDAAMFLQVTSENKGFFLMSPYLMYIVPNDLLTFSGFTEGTYYGSSTGLTKPMLVKKYTNAEDYLNEFIDQLNVETEIVEIIERPDLIKSNVSSLITKQSAAEITYLSNDVKYKVVAYIYLLEQPGTAIWVVDLFGYHAPEDSFDETEYLVLKSLETFKVKPDWAIREAKEVNKRLNIISSTQDSVSETISSSFDYKSESMDRIGDEWSRTTLGVEEVYNPDTGDMHIVPSGSNYYWIDNNNNIYGTDIDESPLPLEDLKKMDCTSC